MKIVYLWLRRVIKITKSKIYEAKDEYRNNSIESIESKNI